jgi:YHS domain-containing protein
MKNVTIVILSGICSLGMLSAYAKNANNIGDRDRTFNSTSAKVQIIAQKSTQSKIYTENGIAIDGTDPVAYFTENRPVRGKNQFTFKWMNATWQFSSQKNRDLFAQNPQKYAPQYGGYCAWAVSQGYLAPTEPDIWKIVNNKLYLNYDRSVQKNWEKNISGHISKGDVNWPKLFK